MTLNLEQHSLFTLTIILYSCLSHHFLLIPFFFYLYFTNHLYHTNFIFVPVPSSIAIYLFESVLAELSSNLPRFYVRLFPRLILPKWIEVAWITDMKLVVEWKEECHSLNAILFRIQCTADLVGELCECYIYVKLKQLWPLPASEQTFVLKMISSFRLIKWSYSLDQEFITNRMEK